MLSEEKPKHEQNFCLLQFSNSERASWRAREREKKNWEGEREDCNVPRASDFYEMRLGLFNYILQRGILGRNLELTEYDFLTFV